MAVDIKRERRSKEPEKEDNITEFSVKKVEANFRRQCHSFIQLRSYDHIEAVYEAQRELGRQNKHIYWFPWTINKHPSKKLLPCRTDINITSRICNINFANTSRENRHSFTKKYQNDVVRVGNGCSVTVLLTCQISIYSLNN